MTGPDHYPIDIGFTPVVKKLQEEHGSREDYAYMEKAGGFKTTITPELARFLSLQTSIFIATVNGDGQPYIQHRGGPPGFLAVLDEQTIGFADYAGNRQYVTTGNLMESDKAFLFLIDYSNGTRIKIWGRATMTMDAALTRRLMPKAYRARPERAFLFKLIVWDRNCTQHIPRRFDAADVMQALEARDQRIAALEAELEALRAHIFKP